MTAVEVVRLPFADRTEAGRLLGRALARRLGVGGRERKSDAPPAVVLGIPRGGVVVAAAVADELGAALDIVVARKIGAPHQRELAVGAVTADGTLLVERWARDVGADEAYVARTAAAEVEAAVGQERRFRAGRPRVPLAGRDAIVVDDGIATGSTMHAALLAARGAGAARVVAAVPVAPAESLERFTAVAEVLVVLAVPDRFFAVGEAYRDFRQTSDDEVVALLGRSAGRRPGI